MNRKPRPLIADSHQVVADACKRMLEPEFEVVDVGANGRALVKSAPQLISDGTVLEVILPQFNGIDVAQQLKQKLPMLTLMLLTANPDVNAAAAAFRSGASAYLSKHSGAEEFMTAIRRVMRGESYLSPPIARETINHILRPSTLDKSDREITSREAEILQLLTEGGSMKQAAAILGISSNTVAFHEYKMMGKLGIETNAELIRYPLRKHMAPPQGAWTLTLIRLGQDSWKCRKKRERDLLGSARGDGERQRQLKGAARTRQRTEDRYATDIQ